MERSELPLKQRRSRSEEMEAERRDSAACSVEGRGRTPTEQQDECKLVGDERKGRSLCQSSNLGKTYRLFLVEQRLTQEKPPNPPLMPFASHLFSFSFRLRLFFARGPVQPRCIATPASLIPLNTPKLIQTPSRPHLFLNLGSAIIIPIAATTLEDAR